MRKLLALAALAALSSTAANAQALSYTTLGSTLSCGTLASCTQNSATSISSNGVTVSFTHAANSGLTAPTLLSLGMMQISGGSQDFVSFTGAQFGLKVTDIASGQDGMFVADFTGSVTSFFSGVVLSYQDFPFVRTIGAFDYAIVNNPLSLVSPSTNQGQTIVQGTASVTTTPEPGTWVLMASGLAALALVARRRNRPA